MLPLRIMVDLPDLATRIEVLRVTLAGNRIGADVNYTTLGEKLDGYTGSDIKEVCREAVVHVAHQRAQFLETGVVSVNGAMDGSSGTMGKREWEKEKALYNQDELLDVNCPLRPVTMGDFKVAMRKLKASVDENGKELEKVQEWNDKYGEVKRSGGKKKKSTSHLSMYI
jgi:SpoVK/Ycf46/Vps4 family AAA+-type ATPase